MLTSQRYEIGEISPTYLITKDQQVDQNDYCASVAITLGDGVRPVSGELLSFTLITYKTGTGAVLTPEGTLIFFDQDPAVSAGDTALTALEHLNVISRVDVSADDWLADANGAIACQLHEPIPFHNLKTVYAVWFHADATSFNDAAGDDEYLAFNAWYRRDT